MPVVPCLIVFCQGMVTVGHGALVHLQHWLALEGDGEQVHEHQLGALAAQEDSIWGEVVHCCIHLSELQEHAEQALDYHMTMITQEFFVIKQATELERWLVHHQLIEVLGEVELAVCWEVGGENGLGQESEADSIGYLLRLLVTGDGVLQHPHSDKSCLPVVME